MEVPFGRRVAHRVYRWRPKKGRSRKATVDIGTPVAVPGSDWGVRLRITGLREAVDQRIFGIDSIQALQLALMLAGKLLVDSPEFKAGEIELWDEPATSALELFLPLPLRELQGHLENQGEFLRRLKLRGRADREWHRGLLVVMRDVARRLSALS